MAQGNKQLTNEKNQSRSGLEDVLGSTALQVQDLSNGDENFILSAGFDVKRKPTPVGLLERPANVVANPGPRRGSLEISWDVVPNARLYELEIIEYPVGLFNKLCQKRENHYIYPIKASLNEQDRRI